MNQITFEATTDNPEITKNFGKFFDAVRWARKTGDLVHIVQNLPSKKMYEWIVWADGSLEYFGDI